MCMVHVHSHILTRHRSCIAIVYNSIAIAIAFSNAIPYANQIIMVRIDIRNNVLCDVGELI